MQRLEVSGAVRPLYGSLGVKGLINYISRSIARYKNENISFDIRNGFINQDYKIKRTECS